ncbi:MAG: LysM peptidoglycan-binding domain-containing protein [Anaerolineales bacterium]|nr:LysM peptidoglycan-binding domain-containing protein [Anaerolineales bacterium]
MKTALTKVLIVALLMSQLVVGIGVAEAAESSCTYYTVRWGDTLYSIARSHGTTVQAIAQASGISNTSLIRVGQVLCIPSGAAPPAPSGGYYTVQRGDTLYSIARRYGTTAQAIALANNIYNPSLIHVGQVLYIPGGPTPPPPPLPPPSVVYYTVQRGDNLYRIARRFGTSVWAIVVANNISNPSLIYRGQVLLIPGPGPVPPAPTPAPPGPTPTPTPRPPTPTPTGFGYGIQVHMIGQDHAQIVSTVKDMGFDWIKHQIVWKDFETSKGNINWGHIDALVNSCYNAGLKVLLSVVKAPAWARGANADLTVNGPPANPQDLANFMGAMAERYEGRVQAYEVWNEQNLHYEWGNEALDANRYVQLLAAAYRAIKAKDPNAIVVSGAPTPCGDNPPIAVDDLTYLERMYQAGLKNYCDAVGVHPSGYNVPPDADWRTWSDPTAVFRGPSDNHHHSWVFRGTMEGSRNIMVRYGDSSKKLWPTEFGWASVGGLGVSPAPGYGYAADNTELEQAQFIVKAYGMGKGWGWVGVMFLWNLNFGPVAGASDEKAAFSILYPNWTPRQAHAAVHDMPK